ncbi:hypothetical protein [Caulobacter sp. 17J80-11]|uniref:hypothetical protein n=1 Tax=Caulobacter sp. 17J80-11 TaxID=2763502 RepID=UPI0016537B69|nr:hypothetical protein [Caulobacter sp. 17J80-11]MBC6983552.1 hypothetical protein [Caulobacter sp. 17J80-11]
MCGSGESELDEGDRLWDCAYVAACDFGDQCAKFARDNPYPDRVALDEIINTLMTELWDRGFSQAEIRTAFEKAVGDMNRYAAGEERNGLRPTPRKT